MKSFVFLKIMRIENTAGEKLTVEKNHDGSRERGGLGNKKVF